MDGFSHIRKIQMPADGKKKTTKYIFNCKEINWLYRHAKLEFLNSVPRGHQSSRFSPPGNCIRLGCRPGRRGNLVGLLPWWRELSNPAPNFNPSDCRVMIKTNICLWGGSHSVTHSSTGIFSGAWGGVIAEETPAHFRGWMKADQRRSKTNSICTIKRAIGMTGFCKTGEIIPPISSATASPLPTVTTV